MALLYTFEGWPASPSVNNVIRTYNLDAGTWSSTGFTAAPFSGTVASAGSFRQQGGYDPSAGKWYVISPTGTLYAYATSGNTWSGPLASGMTLVYNTAEDHHWSMVGDGRFVYILKAENSTMGVELFRYDPAADTLDTLNGPPVRSSYSVTNQGKYFLVYDGGDHLFSYNSNDVGAVEEYTISTGRYRNLPLPSGAAADGAGTTAFGLFAGGNLLFIYAVNNSKGVVWSYDPVTNIWTQKTSVSFVFNVTTKVPYHLDSASTLRIWNTNGGNESYVYNFVTDTWSNAGINIPFTPGQGCNWAESRVFSAEYTWFEADGVTPLGNNGHRADVGMGTIDFTFSYHVKVQTNNARPSGVTVSLPTMLDYDGDDVTTISNTQNGIYSASFSINTALLAGDMVDVWIKVMPSILLSLGTQKTFNLKVVSNS